MVRHSSMAPRSPWIPRWSCLWRRDGTPHIRCAVEDGVATYLDLSGADGRARLVVLAFEVGGQMVFRNTSILPAALQQRHVGLVVEVEFDSGLCHVLGHDGPSPTTRDIISVRMKKRQHSKWCEIGHL